jgi:hypothetical protein
MSAKKIWLVPISTLGFSNDDRLGLDIPPNFTEKYYNTWKNQNVKTNIEA